MAIQQNNNQRLFNTTITIALLGLVFIGVWLIIQSHNIYNQSYEITQKILDTSYKKQGVTLQAPNYASIKDGYGQALSFFTLALAALFIVLLLPRLQTFSISPTGGISVTLKDLQEQVTQLKIQNNELQAKTADEGGGKTFDETKAHEVKIMMTENKKASNKIASDPQKNQWGGKSESNDRRLSAVVRKSLLPSFYEVDLTVTGTKEKSLTGLVTFHLHDTFKNPDPTIAVINGEATLSLKRVYGAFTVGAEADNAVTRLELDLAELKDVPKEFKER